MTDSRTMTLADLLHLVDRARRGTILAPELDDLHAGITAMATDRDSWETTAYRNASLWRTEQSEVQRHVTANLEAAERAQQEIERVREWANGDVVTARNEFGNGYREAMRDIRDLLPDPAQRPAAATTKETAS